MQEFECDPDKSRRNQLKHGIELEWAQSFWRVSHVILEGKRVAGESRLLIVAKVLEKHYVAAFTMRGQTIRLISCHRARGRLVRYYEEQIEIQKAH